MKTNSKFKLFNFTIVAFTLTLVGCGKTDEITNNTSIPCKNEIIDLGTVFLSPETLDFKCYSGKEKIYFKNDIGEEIMFEPLFGELSHSFNNWSFELECDEGDTNRYKFINEQYSVSFTCKVLNLNFYYNLYSFHSFKYPKFVEFCTLSLFETSLDNILDINIITSFKKNEELIALEFKNYTSFNNFSFKEKIVLNNKSFENVYCVLKSENKLLTELYFTKEIGLVGFKDLDSKLWVIDRIE